MKTIFFFAVKKKNSNNFDSLTQRAREPSMRFIKLKYPPYAMPIMMHINEGLLPSRKITKLLINQ